MWPYSLQMYINGLHLIQKQNKSIIKAWIRDISKKKNILLDYNKQKKGEFSLRSFLETL